MTARFICSLAFGVVACGGATKAEKSPQSAAAVPVASDPPASEPAPEDDAEPADLGEPTLAAPPPEPTPPTATPTDPRPLEGPYEALDDYRREHPPGHDASCGPLPKASTPPKHLGGRGGIAAARLVRLPDSFACAPVEYCLLAVRTQAGWYVRRTEEPCHGVIGTGKEARLPKVSSRWVNTGDSWVLAIEETRQVTSIEVTDDRGTRRESSHEHESRYITLCGLGASGVPSCTEALVLSCPKADGTTSEVSWSVSGGTLALESDTDADDPCDMDAPFVVGDIPLEFP